MRNINRLPPACALTGNGTLRSVHSCFLVCFGEWPKLCWDLKVTGPLKLLFFALLKFFPPILLEQGPLLGALSVSRSL